jgi:transposase-like protein
MAFRKKLSAEVKSKIVLKALKEQNTANEIASEFQVHPVQIAKWKKQAIAGMPSLFESQSADDKKAKHQLVETKDIYEQLGRLQMQLEWIKKKSSNEQ